jgi:integrase
MTRRRGNNEGCLHQRANGTWQALVSLQGHRISHTSKTRHEAQEWLRQTLKQVDDGLSYASTKLTLANYLEEWLAGEKSAMRQSTWGHYEQLTRSYIYPMIGKLTLKDLRTAHLQGFYNRLGDQKVGIPTIRKIHKLLHSSLSAALETGLIMRNPAAFAHPPHEPMAEMKILDESQVSQFLVSIIGHQWEALFYLAITTGMRRGELLGLKWEDLDWLKGTVKVDRQASRCAGAEAKFLPLKTRFSRRTIALGEKTIRILRDHYERERLKRFAAGKQWIETGLIFTGLRGKPIFAGNVLKVFQALLKEAGLPKIRFHDLRHTAASLMLNNGIPVLVASRRLGHSRPSTTLDIYGHLLEGMQGEAATLMDELVTPVKLYPTVPDCNRMDEGGQNAMENEEIPVITGQNSSQST